MKKKGKIFMITRMNKNKFEINGRQVKLIIQNIEMLLPIKVTDLHKAQKVILRQSSNTESNKIPFSTYSSPPSLT